MLFLLFDVFFSHMARRQNKTKHICYNRSDIIKKEANKHLTKKIEEKSVLVWKKRWAKNKSF